MREVLEIRRDDRENCKALYFMMFAIGLLLLVRDAFGVSINKYIILAVVAVATFAFPIEKVVYFIAFLMPLYVGIPGNYLTLVFLVRFLGETHRVHFNSRGIICCVLAGGYAFVDALVHDNTEIAQLVFFPSMVLVMLIYSLRVPYSKNRLVLCYSLGVAALGLIMLISTLQVYDLMDLLTSATRLGDDATSFAEEGIMNVSVDPNFYGMFAIAAISTGVEVFGNNRALSKAERVCLLVALCACAAVALIGLSRAFFLMIFAWGMLYALSRKKAKTLLLFAIVAIIAGVAVYMFMPDVLDAIFARLSEDNVSDGGGRVSMIERYYSVWATNAQTMLFGVGIFDCYVHCTPLQALFGGGLVFTVFIAGFISTLGVKRKAKSRVPFLRKWLPMIATVLMAVTVPALMLINSMYPLIFVGQYCLAEKE